MTLDKVLLYDYGATGLKSFLDAHLNSPTMLHRTIHPNEDCLFYVGVLFTQDYDVARAGLILEEQNLLYKVTGRSPQFDRMLIPCGQLLIKR